MSAATRPRRVMTGIIIGERLRLRLIEEMLLIAQQHEQEPSQIKRCGLEKRFDALNGLVRAPGPGKRP